MAETDKVFAGSIPELYDRFLVPLIFEYYARDLADRVARADPSHVLETAAGTGAVTRELASSLPASASVTVTDLNRPMLDHAATRLRHDRRFVWRQADALALPFADQSFDVVTCLEVLEHLAQPRTAAEELRRVARRAVVLSVPYEPWFRAGNVLRGNHLSRLGNHPEHVQHWNLRSFGEFLAPVFREVRLTEAFPWIIACCRPDQH